MVLYQIRWTYKRVPRLEEEIFELEESDDSEQGKKKEKKRK